MAGETARLFFAAWPAPAVQQALAEVSGQLTPVCGGRAIRASNIHLTLVFLGDIPRERLQRLELRALAIAAPPFELNVDRVEYWRHNRIVWAGVTQCPPALLALVTQLEAGLSAESFRLERRPYVPHITLLRDARRAPAAPVMPAVCWPVARFALVKSTARDTGRAYEVLREWPLAG